MDEEKGGGGDGTREGTDGSRVRPSIPDPDPSGVLAPANESAEADRARLECAASLSAAESRLQGAWFDALNLFHEETAAAEQKLAANLAAIATAERAR
mmetsp:Transcript_54737/g.150881  ORF Transcript_54737/g.150881 Transcript_54737/m.150881 type:complete len:98 (+) Transcript_54737:1082-1375(+)